MDSVFKYVFDENAQRCSLDDKRKRIEKYAFSNENASVWTGPKIFDILGVRIIFAFNQNPVNLFDIHYEIPPFLEPQFDFSKTPITRTKSFFPWTCFTVIFTPDISNFPISRTNSVSFPVEVREIEVP